MRLGLQAWGSEGDIRPFTELSAGLVRNGHEVTLVVTDNEGRDYGTHALASGYRVIEARGQQPPDPAAAAQVWRQIIQSGNPITQAELVMKYGFDPFQEAMLEAATELCRTNDAVIGHFFVYPLQAAAEKAGVPAATVNIVHNCLPSRHICPPGFPDFGSWSYPFGWKIAQRAVNGIFLPRVNSLRKSLGLAPQTNVMTQTWASQRLNLIAVSKYICDRPGDWELRHQVCGFLSSPAAAHEQETLRDDLLRFLDAGPPPVYFTFGSMLSSRLGNIAETAAIWLEAIKAAGIRAIVQLPALDGEQIVTPPSVFRGSRTPYAAVFPRCSLIVHHGGSGTTQSALRAGRPSLVVAHVSDQFFWGAELERLGVAGQTVKRNRLTAVRLGQAIQNTLANGQLALRAAELGNRLQSENGVLTAVDLIERMLLRALAA